MLLLLYQIHVLMCLCPVYILIGMADAVFSHVVVYVNSADTARLHFRYPAYTAIHLYSLLFCPPKNTTAL